MCTVRVWNLVVICFNRYMVECELHHYLSSVCVHRGFNRYMVECECRNYCFGICRDAVLIDTWWNVNYLE